MQLKSHVIQFTKKYKINTDTSFINYLQKSAVHGTKYVIWNNDLLWTNFFFKLKISLYL